MSDIPTVTYYAYSGTQYIGQYSGEDSAVLAFIAGKGWTTGPKPLASDRDLWISIVSDATSASSSAERDAAAAALSASSAASSAATASGAVSDAIGVTVQAHSAVLDATTASFTTADETKLDGIEASADVTDTANVTAAGALMDSEVTNLADVKAFDPADYATATQGGKADSAQQPPSEGAFADGDKTKLDGIETGADVTDATNVEAAGALMDSEVTNLADVKAFDPADYAAASHTQATSTIIGLDSALAAKAPLASPALTGTPTAPTPTASDNSTKIATTAYVDAAAGGGGDLVLLDEVTIPAATASVEMLLPSGYTSYQLRLDGVVCDDNGTRVLELRGSQDGGSTYVSADYAWYGSGTSFSSDTSDTQIDLIGSSQSDLDAADRGITGTIDFYTTNAFRVVSHLVVEGHFFCTAYHSGTGFDAFELAFSSDNLNGGTVSLFGFKEE